ncbi:MAG: integrin alpha, partial [Rickettsiales bacterium]
NKAVYVLFGQSPANWNTDKTTAATGSTPDIINIDTRVAAGGTEAVRFTSTGIFIGMYTMAVADMNNDGIKDLILNSAFSHYVYYGKVGGWSNVDLAVASNYNGVNGMIFYLGGSCPIWWTAANSKAIAKDINGDGKTDIVFTYDQADPDSTNNSGTSFVALQPSAGWSSLWSPTLGASGVAGTLNLCGDIFDATGTALPLNNDVSKGFRIDGAAAFYYSSLLGIADINNDGKNDLIIGSPYNSGFTKSSVYILFGKTLVPWDTKTNLQTLN